MELPNEILKKTVIFTGYRCNSKCTFCLDLLKRDTPDRPTKEIMTELVQAKKRGTRLLEFIGGEVTIRKDVFHIVAFAAKLGFEVSMATNGRMMCYDDFAKKMADTGIFEMIFSIHGHDDAMHDRLTAAPGSFKEIITGYKNAQKYGIPRVSINHTVVKQNYPYLPELADLFISLNPTATDFIFVDPTYGGAHERFEQIVPRISEVAPYLREAIRKGRLAAMPSWRARYVPLCYFPDYLDNISELHEVAHFKTEHIAPDFANYDVSAGRKEVGKMQVEQCKTCVLNDRCEGIWREYIKHYGSDELKPVTEAGVLPISIKNYKLEIENNQ